MDQNYEDEELQPIEEQLPPFVYQSKDEVRLNKLVHSILAESSKAKPVVPNCLTKRICQSVGLQSNDEIFFNLLGNLAGYSLNSAVTEVKNVLRSNKSKKDRVLTTAEVKKTLEDREVYLCASKAIPEMGISQSKQTIYEAMDDE